MDEDKKEFDLRGLLYAINEIGLRYKLPLPSGICACIICLGANIPGQEVYPEGGWCCGSWVDHSLPPLGICERFGLYMDALKDLVKKLQPDETTTSWVEGHDKPELREGGEI